MLFKYSGVSSDGQKQTGTIDVANKDTAISSLQNRGLTLYSIEPVRENSIFSQDIAFLTPITSKDLVILSRQVSTLFQARVSALEVFRVLAEETQNSRLRAILYELAEDIQGGSSIAQAMSQHPEAFSHFFVSMVKAGEESGRLSDVFEQLSRQIKRSYEMSSRARNALIYPAFVLVALIVVVILMMVFVIPQISTVLTQSGQQLPIYTRIVLGLSEFFAAWWLWLFVLVTAGVAGLIWYGRTDEGEVVIDQFMLNIPYIGTLFQRLYLARFADTMHTMIDAGIPMVRALEIAEDTVGGAIYPRMVRGVREDVRGGSALSVALASHPDMPGIFTQMVRVGEESGQLGPMLDTISAFYRQEVESIIDTLIGFIEPILMIIIGVGVAVLLAAILMPIYNMVGAF